MLGTLCYVNDRTPCTVAEGSTRMRVLVDSESGRKVSKAYKARRSRLGGRRAIVRGRHEVTKESESYQQFTMGDRVIVLNSVMREQAEIVDVYGDNYQVRFDDGRCTGCWFNWRALQGVKR